MRRLASIMSSSAMPGNSIPLNRTPGAANARAMARIGAFPGRNCAIRQEVPALANKPRCRAGFRPQLTSEDFPLPEVPTTARKRVRASLSIIASTWLSRPKNRCSSESWKGLKPGNGFATLATIGLAIRLLPAKLGKERFHRGLRCALQAVQDVGLFQIDQVVLIGGGRLCEVHE